MLPKVLPLFVVPLASKLPRVRRECWGCGTLTKSAKEPALPVLVIALGEGRPCTSSANGNGYRYVFFSSLVSFSFY